MGRLGRIHRHSSCSEPYKKAMLIILLIHGPPKLFSQFTANSNDNLPYDIQACDPISILQFTRGNLRVI